MRSSGVLMLTDKPSYVKRDIKVTYHEDGEDTASQESKRLKKGDV